MKARIRKTGEIVEIISYNSSTDRNYVSDYVSYIDSNGVKHNKELLNYYWDFELMINEDIDKAHWQDVRERAAMAALQGILANPTIIDAADDHRLTAVKDAVGFADELVKQLKQNTQNK